MPAESHLSRRSFLRIAGATGAAGVAAAACSPKATAQKLYPFLTPPEDIIPGTPVFYRTVCRGCSAGCGVTAKTREGRVIKLEGNPEDPIGRGALCARGQAALQEVYSPERFKGPMRRAPDGTLQPIAWTDALSLLADKLLEARGRRVSGVRLLTRPEPGSAGALQRAFMASFEASNTQRVVLESFDHTALRSAGERLFGRAELPAFDLAAAKSVVAFGADFLETWLSPVELTRGFSDGRGKAGTDRTRLTWVGPRLPATAGSADIWLSARAGTERIVALGILRWLLDPANAVADLPSEIAELRGAAELFTLAEVERSAGVPAAQMERLCRELAQRRPSALLGPGPSSAGTDALELAIAIQLVNYVLGNIGRTVLYGVDPLEDTPSSFADVQALVADMGKGEVDILLLHHADPVGSLPASLGARDAIAKVPFVVSFSERPDATTALAHLVLPDNHALEAFGDVTPRKGFVSLCQPVMRPLADTRSASQVLLDVSERIPLPSLHFPFKEFYEYTQTRAELYAMVERGAVGDLIAVQREALGRGGYYQAAEPARVELRRDGLPPAGRAAEPIGDDTFNLVPFPTSLRGDGRSADLPWLKEVPDVTSTVSWGPWAELSPAAAERLGVRNGDVVALTTGAGSAELPVFVYRGLRDDAIAVPLGGPEVLALVAAKTDGAGGLAWIGARAHVRKTGRAQLMPQADAISEKPDAEIVKHVTPEEPALAPVPAPETMYPPPEHPKHRWAMAIDLDRCSGCQACVVACYAENNVPVMGPQFAAAGRNMAWLRIERYFEPEGGVDFLPMLCQQCGNAPCEPVCPVYATYHTPEGLNAQVYNRCVGTRYCSNNCPYKVRTFNYRDPQFASPLEMQLNPDVSVRSKGVMEKCTFCVQRVRFGENAAKSDGRAVRDGEIVPACAQTCAGQAIVFGDANDPDSRVSRLQKDPRGFHALEELNTAPAVTYLARVKGGKP